MQNVRNTAPPPANRIRENFPITRKRAYLNNASVGPMSTRVIERVNAFLSDVRDNGRNNYPEWCRYADRAVKGRIADLVGARAEDIAFMKNTTEGLVTVANGLDWREGDNVVIADIEYPSNVYCWMRLARRGVGIRWIAARNGRVPPEAYAEAIDSRTRLISVSAVQFATGYRSDLTALSEICARLNVLLNVDAIQWIGALQLDLAALDIAFLSTGGHKWLLAPIGTGFFYCNPRYLDLLDPPSVGYHSVDKHEAHMDYDLTLRPDAGRFEEALVNFPGIWGLDAAVETLLELGSAQAEGHIAELAGLAAEGLRQRGWCITSPMGEGERSGIVTFDAPGIDAEALAERLRAAGVDIAARGGAARISPSFYNDASDIERFLAELGRP